MKIIEYGNCVYEGSKESHNISSKEDLLRYKQVFDLTQDPPVLVYTKTDEELYIEWTQEEINEFAQEHIFKYYPLWKQSNISREGTEEQKSTMSTFINAVRAWSNQSPLPDGFDGSLELITP